ncbi:hypothetical protein CLOP_g3914 [Closterium sp. NIES-67]|nr:hypothetical protein CLOP_g3914 [Closterium sp. NIES-67]
MAYPSASLSNPITPLRLDPNGSSPNFKEWSYGVDKHLLSRKIEGICLKDLNRPVYGLKQAPREWHKKLKATLESLDFHPSSADPSLFIRKNDSPFFILVYVDDMILVSKDSDQLAAVKQALGDALAMKDLVATPLPLQHDLTAPSIPSPEPCDEAYPELVGSLMYAMMCTRPDLAYPISVLSRYVAAGRYTNRHWSAAKRVLRYLQATKDYVLTFGGTTPPHLEGYSDSSWADDQADRRSSQGYCFTLGSANLCCNSLNGPIPASFSGLASLAYLDLQENALSEAIPDAISLMTALTSLYLSSNRLSGGIPPPSAPSPPSNNYFCPRTFLQKAFQRRWANCCSFSPCTLTTTRWWAAFPTP